MLRLLPLMLLASCCTWPRGFLFVPDHHEAAFATECGVEVDSPRPGDAPLPSGWTLIGVQSVERRALRALGTTSDARFWSGCTRLRGWRIWVASVPDWNSAEHGIRISGMTDCGSGVIQIGSRAPADGTLAHELAHAIQGCEPVDDGKHYLDSHLGWAPIYEALRAEGLRP